MTDLIKTLRAKVTFDEVAVEDAAVVHGCVKIQIGRPGIFHVDSEYFDDGARYENARLAPILEKLIAAVDVAEKVRCCKWPSTLEGCSNEQNIRKVLADLRAAVRGDERLQSKQNHYPGKDGEK